MGLRCIAAELALALMVVLMVAPAAQAQPTPKRVALVIGNAAYPQNGLRNPVNDARAMGATLRLAGFTVISRENATKVQMEQAVGEFGRLLAPGSVALFYFAGHGMQVGGRNFLVPVDAKVATEQAVRLETLDVDLVLDQVAAAGTDVNLVILDACRHNPFERRFRAVGGGLAQINAPKGTLIAYATAPGKVAADGEADNGLYTAKLIQAMKTPGLPLEEVFKRVRIEVSRDSKEAQTPWEASSLVGNFYFLGPTTLTVSPAPALDREALHWQSVKDSNDAAQIQTYLDEYPKGAFAGLARARLAAMRQSPTATASPPAGTSRAFDGTWLATIVCDKTRDGALGYTHRLPAQVKDGVLIGQFVSQDNPAALTLSGVIKADGSAFLSVSGRTGAEGYTVGRVRPGSSYSYTANARFEGSLGSGTRNELRNCNLSFVKQ